MKKYFFTFLLPVAMMLGLLSGCQSIFAQQMTMTTRDFKVELRLAGEGEVIIDWGDGTPSDKGTLGDDYTSYKHSYSNSSTHTITITGSKVTGLDCRNNELTSLDLSKNNVLEELDCRINKLTSLDVSNNNALIGLDCSMNQLISLDLSKNKVLEELNCYYNKLTSLDLSNNIKLKKLNCHYNKLTSLDVSNNSVLGKLYCDDNQLTSLDVSKNPVLLHLDCRENQLTSIALNALFESLHSNTVGVQKTINIKDNPGESSCKINVAESKGWQVIAK